MKDDRKLFVFCMLMLLLGAIGGCNDSSIKSVVDAGFAVETVRAVEVPPVEQPPSVILDEVQMWQADGYIWEVMTEEQRKAVANEIHKRVSSRSAKNWKLFLEIFYRNSTDEETMQTMIVDIVHIYLQSEVEEGERKLELYESLNSIFSSPQQPWIEPEALPVEPFLE